MLIYQRFIVQSITQSTVLFTCVQSVILYIYTLYRLQSTLLQYCTSAMNATF